MAGNIFFDQNLQTLQKVIDLRQKNQQVIASNVANAETPGYKPRRFEFEKSLQNALSQKDAAKTTNSRHLSSAGNISSVRGEINSESTSVNVDQEMVALSENQILYEAAVQMLNKKLGLLKYIAQDGR